MTSEAYEVAYNPPEENALFGQNTVEKITDTCLGQDGKRYYQVRWRESWEPEERLLTACEVALQTFWQEYYANVEQQIRKQSKPVQSIVAVTTTIDSEQSQVAAAQLAMFATAAVAPVQIVQVEPTITTNAAPSNTIEGVAINDMDNRAAILAQIIRSVNGAAVDRSGDVALIGSGTSTATTASTSNSLGTKVVSSRGGGSQQRFNCDVCEQSFVSKRNVQRHMLSHTGEKPWMCQFCFKRFRQKPHLEQHVNIHRGVKNNVCEECGKAFNHHSNLVTHRAVHSDARPYVCGECGVSFKLKHTLQKHEIIHSKAESARSGKLHECSVCQHSFRDRSYLAEHMTIHDKQKQWRCEVCGKSFAFKRRYQLHMQLHSDTTGSMVDDTVDPLTCPICARTFRTEAQVQKHLQKHAKVALHGPAQAMFTPPDKAMDNQNAENNIDRQKISVQTFSNDNGSLLVIETEPSSVPPVEQIVETTTATTVGDISSTVSLLRDGGAVIPSVDYDATYVALSQLTQAAAQLAPLEHVDALSNDDRVIVMTYDELQRSIGQVSGIPVNFNQVEGIPSNIGQVAGIPTCVSAGFLQADRLDAILKVAADQTVQQKQTSEQQQQTSGQHQQTSGQQQTSGRMLLDDMGVVEKQ